MAAKELKERKEGGNERKGLCPQNTQMDADEAGFIPIGVNARALAIADAAEHAFPFSRGWRLSGRSLAKADGSRFKKFPGQGFGPRISGFDHFREPFVLATDPNCANRRGWMNRIMQIYG
jgi:hypothetical protein